MTPEALILQAKDWTDFLSRTLPEHRLLEVLHEAFDGKTNGYLLSAHDMKSAWGRVIEKEKAEHERARNMRGVEKAKEIRCRRCLDSGSEILYLDDGTKLGARPGMSCRHHPLHPGEWLYREEKRFEEMANEMYGGGAK